MANPGSAMGALSRPTQLIPLGPAPSETLTDSRQGDAERQEREVEGRSSTWFTRLQVRAMITAVDKRHDLTRTHAESEQ